MASGSASGSGGSPLPAMSTVARGAIHIPPNVPQSISSVSASAASDSAPIQTSASVPPLHSAFSYSSDFARQQQAKQQHSNYHSTSLSTSLKNMVAASVNRTSLHPSGVQYV
ncbi:hypothetical protein ACJ72_07385 [Emergomyces africanus]|uniref:Uncharacterized protein n=1 Tax=Emergomyces africanus TaxID=1955775 RepID=A0A1B7NNF0_9EURO|nr:hypothetical protein ACJ72_07385 [Emergomyces africanus]